MATKVSDNFIVSSTSAALVKSEIVAAQRQMITLLKQFQKEVNNLESYWENSFTTDFKSKVTTYINNVQKKQEVLTDNLTQHLSITITVTEELESALIANASLFND